MRRWRRRRRKKKKKKKKKRKKKREELRPIRRICGRCWNRCFRSWHPRADSTRTFRIPCAPHRMDPSPIPPTRIAGTDSALERKSRPPLLPLASGILSRDSLQGCSPGMLSGGETRRERGGKRRNALIGPFHPPHSSSLPHTRRMHRMKHADRIHHPGSISKNSLA